MELSGKNILITGAARRVGRALALAVAQAGGTVILHFGSSSAEAERRRRTSRKPAEALTCSRLT
jgi:NAD(P)-dependent dehydrogenase (short-subunit alcohol dehydrogenase family)